MPNLPAQDGPDPQKRVFGVRFSPQNAAEIANRVVSETPAPSEALRLLVTANLDHIVTLTGNAEFRAAYDAAWLATIDGAPVFLYANWRGAGVKERVTGADLFPRIFTHLEPDKHRPLFVCSRNDTASELKRRLAAQGFVDTVAIVPPHGFDADPIYCDWLVSAIRANATTHLFFGLGAPKSELWMYRHRSELRGCYGFAFGAGLDFHAGTRLRAPLLMQRFGLEWLWRVATEPRRLARRYFVNSWGFLSAIRQDLSHS